MVVGKGRWDHSRRRREGRTSGSWQRLTVARRHATGCICACSFLVVKSCSHDSLQSCQSQCTSRIPIHLPTAAETCFAYQPTCETRQPGAKGCTADLPREKGETNAAIRG